MEQHQPFCQGRGSVKLNVFLDSQTFIGTGAPSAARYGVKRAIRPRTRRRVRSGVAKAVSSSLGQPCPDPSWEVRVLLSDRGESTRGLCLSLTDAG